MSDPITVAIEDPPKHKFSELEYFIGHRLYRKGTNPEWYVDYFDREMANMVVINLEVNGFKVRIMGDPPKQS